MEETMRKALILTVLLTLTSLVVASPLVVCPFLQAKPACCRKTTSHAPRCPLAPTLERCPFYMTEAKIGQAEQKASVADAAISTSHQSADAPAMVACRASRPERVADGAGSYLRNRVLRL
jgi:hypothetical protein